MSFCTNYECGNFTCFTEDWDENWNLIARDCTAEELDLVYDELDPEVDWHYGSDWDADYGDDWDSWEDWEDYDDWDSWEDYDDWGSWEDWNDYDDYGYCSSWDDTCTTVSCDKGNYCEQVICRNEWCSNSTCTQTFYDDDWNYLSINCMASANMDANEIASRIGDQIGISAGNVDELVGTTLDVTSEVIAARLDDVFGDNSNTGRVVDEILSGDELKDSISDVFEAVLPGLNDFFGSFMTADANRMDEQP